MEFGPKKTRRLTANAMFDFAVEKSRRENNKFKHYQSAQVEMHKNWNEVKKSDHRPVRETLVERTYDREISDR